MINIVLLLQTIGACTAVHILTPGFVGASQGSGGKGNLFSGIYGELHSWGGGGGRGGCVLGSRDLTKTFLGAGKKGNFLSESRELSPHPQTR